MDRLRRMEITWRSLRKISRFSRRDCCGTARHIYYCHLLQSFNAALLTMVDSFPKKDCCCLPLVHSSAEELARYLVGFGA